MPDLTLLAPLAAALADQDRLRAYAAVVLAGPEGLDPAAVGPHAGRLRQAGLLEPAADGGRLVADAGVFAAALRSPAPAEGAELAAFFRDGRLTEIPVRPAKRAALLAHLTERAFQPGVSYSEPEINIALKQYWDDCAALRRYLITGGFLTRSADGTAYRVAEPAATTAAD